MKQKQFEDLHAVLWEEIALILKDNSARAEALPALYRRLCLTLALATQRGYSPALTDYLHKMVGDCHRRLYGAVVERPLTLRHWLLHTFPHEVRREWRLLTLAMVAFWGVAIAVGLLVWMQPHWAYSFISPRQLAQIQDMYQPSRIHLGRAGSEGDVQMFGFYIWNNVSIDFRTFAGGLFAGIPALISLFFNGMHLGVVAAWLSKDPGTREMFWSFVITHSSFEIAGLLLAAVAGMRLGLTLLWPGRLARRDALFLASQKVFPIILGAAFLTVLAAFFEAFWSAGTFYSSTVKYAVGTACWLLVIGFFTFAGRTGR